MIVAGFMKCFLYFFWNDYVFKNSLLHSGDLSSTLILLKFYIWSSYIAGINSTQS